MIDLCKFCDKYLAKEDKQKGERYHKVCWKRVAPLHRKRKRNIKRPWRGGTVNGK